MLNLITCYVHFSEVGILLRGTSYSNNSLVTIDDIGTDNNALFCLTPFTCCCSGKYTKTTSLGDWFLPGGSRVESRSATLDRFRRTRGASIVLLHQDGNTAAPAGIFTCSIPVNNATTSLLFIAFTSTRLHFTSIDFTSLSLHFTSLHFTSLLLAYLRHTPLFLRLHIDDHAFDFSISVLSLSGEDFLFSDSIISLQS